MSTDNSTRGIAASVVAAADRGNSPEPRTGTAATAEGMVRDAARFTGKIDHLANTSRDGALTDLAFELNKARFYDRDEEFCPNIFDVDDVLDRIVARRRK